jgi:rhamnogalacturonan hydrolase
MPGDFKKPPPSDAPFTIPPVPTTFYPRATPVSTLLNLKSPGGFKDRRSCKGV